MTPGPRVFPAVPVAGAEGGRSIDEAEIVVAGIDLAGPSHELRVFLDNAAADADTQPTPDDGYAGSIYVYGHAGALSRSDQHEPLPITRTLVATDAVRRALAGGETASVTLVAVGGGGKGDIDLDALDVSVLGWAGPRPA